MADNQQIQNFIDALEQATDISVDADLTAESIAIEDGDGDVAHITEGGRLLVSFPEPVDVSDATVTVTDDGSLDINSLPEPVTIVDDGNLLVSDILSTVTVTDDGSLDVSSVGGVVTTTTGSTTNGSTYGVQQAETTPSLIVGANESRESVLLQNKGTEDIFVGFDDSLSSLTGVRVTAGGTYADDSYTGPLYAVTNSGTVNVAFQDIATQ
jgi:hypothetical protein